MLHDTGSTMNPPMNALTIQLLEWISNHPRTYAEALDAWRTSCPRLSIWEDACIAGLIDCEPGSRIVSVSRKGHLLLGQRHQRNEDSPAHENLDPR
jgi:hypothetical protein